MALNSYATPEGLEIGRAQAVQAEAARVPCHTDMNPLADRKPLGIRLFPQGRARGIATCRL